MMIQTVIGINSAMMRAPDKKRKEIDSLDEALDALDDAIDIMTDSQEEEE